MIVQNQDGRSPASRALYSFQFITSEASTALRSAVSTGLQTGGALCGRAANFAIRQAVSSPDFAALVPVGKTTVYILVTLWSQMQSVQAGSSCPPETFQCEDGECIPDSWPCDNSTGCVDGSDEGPTLCNQNKCNELDRPFLCNNRCIEHYLQCDGYDHCGDGSDEGSTLCNQSKYKELDRPILCNDRCIDPGLQCNGVDNCGDGSDEGSTLCNPCKCYELERPYLCSDRCMEFPWQNGYCRDRDFEGSDGSYEQNCVTYTTATDTEETSSQAWVSAPVILGTVALAAGVAYGTCAYRSFRALRQANNDAPSCQLVGKALKHPLCFRPQIYQALQPEPSGDYSQLVQMETVV